MKNILFALLALVSPLTAATPLFTCSNFYIGGFGGVNFLEAIVDRELQMDFVAGYAVGGNLGFLFGKCIQVEGEFSYRQNAFDSLTNGEESIELEGHLSQKSLFANALFNLNFQATKFLIGAGVGNRWEEGSAMFQVETDEGTMIFKKSGKEKGVVYQFIGGMIFPVSFGEFGVEYRYLRGPKMQINHTLDIALRLFF